MSSPRSSPFTRLPGCLRLGAERGQHQAGQRFALGLTVWWHEHAHWITDSVYPPTYHCTSYELDELPQLDDFEPELVRGGCYAT